MPERERAPESASLGQRPRQQAERPRRAFAHERSV
jgi:hypothetical protein